MVQDTTYVPEDEVMVTVVGRNCSLNESVLLTANGCQIVLGSKGALQELPACHDFLLSPPCSIKDISRRFRSSIHCDFVRWMRRNVKLDRHVSGEIQDVVEKWSPLFNQDRTKRRSESV